MLDHEVCDVLTALWPFLDLYNQTLRVFFHKIPRSDWVKKSKEANNSNKK